MPQITQQSLIPNTSDNQLALEYLKEFSAIGSSAQRKGFAIRNRTGKTNKSKRAQSCEISKQLEKEYGDRNSEAKNASTAGEAIYASQKALVELNISLDYELLRSINKSIKKVEYKIAKERDHSRPNALLIKRYKQQIGQKKARAQRILDKISVLKKRRDTGRFKVCFGSPKLFSAAASPKRKWVEYSYSRWS